MHKKHFATNIAQLVTLWDFVWVFLYTYNKEISDATSHQNDMQKKTKRKPVGAELQKKTNNNLSTKIHKKIDFCLPKLHRLHVRAHCRPLGFPTLHNVESNTTREAQSDLLS